MNAVSQPKNILITGCSTGIGYAAAVMCHQRGHRVIATCRNLTDKTALEKLGLTSLLLDLNDDDSISAAIIDALKHFNGRIDVLFNNAAFGQPGAVEDLTRESLQSQFNTNVFGTQQLTNIVLRHFRQQGHGRVVYNSSVLGFISLPYRGAYNASKHAIEALADTLRLETFGSGIEVILIEPGPIVSEFRANAYRKYQQYIDAENSAHKATYEAMVRRLTATEETAPFTLPATAVAEKLLHAIESKHPKARYRVTFPTYLFAVLKRLCSTRVLDWVLRKVSKGEQQ